MRESLLFLILCSAAQGEVFDVSIPENDTATYNYADFRIWVNDSTDTLKGIYWFMHHNNGDSRDIVNDSSYQNLVNGQDFALLGAHIYNMHMNTGIGDAVIAAMDSFAVLSEHPELSFIPFFINGYSWGGQFGYHFAKWIPDRVLGLITQKGGYHDTTDAGSAIEIPSLMIVGEEDFDYRIENLTGIFLDHRPLGAKWALAMEPGAGHAQVTDHAFLNAFFNTVADLRMNNDANVFEPISLSTLPDSIGWLGNQISYRIGSWDCYDGIFDSSSWFPERSIGEHWQDFVSINPTDTSVCDPILDDSYVYFTIGIHGMDSTSNYTITTNNQSLIDQCRSQLDLDEDERNLHVNGYLDYGDGGFNQPWSWHILPNEWELAEMSIGTCNGDPNDVESDLDYWINTVGQLCNWGSFIKEEIGYVQDTSQTTIHVSVSGSDSTGDGSVINPFASIQKGLDESNSGDTVLVDSGLYTENIIWPQTYGLKLIGSGEESCIIDGDSTGRVISFIDTLNAIIDTNTMVTGFTIQNGFSDFENTGEKPGGGIYCINASPMITDCSISHNYAYGDGGGIALIDSSNIKCSNVKIHNNTAKGDPLPGMGNRYKGKGGGVLIVNSAPIFINVEITNNYAGKYGAGAYALYSSPTFMDFVISGNGGSGFLQKGGGVLCEGTPNSTFMNGAIFDNGNSETGAPPYIGGGIFVGPAPFDSSSLFSTQLINVNIFDNVSRQWGGGIAGSGISISGGTIKDNTAAHQGGGIYLGGNVFGVGNIEFSSINRTSIYSNIVEDSIAVGNDIYTESTLDIVVDTFTVVSPTDYYAAPMDSITFDILTGLDDLTIKKELMPSKFVLHSPFPNPFNPTTTINFDILQNTDNIELKVYDVTGRIIEKLLNEKVDTGSHSLLWDASSHSTGIYYIQLLAGEQRLVKKLILLK